LENSTPPLESGPEHDVSRRVERMRRIIFFTMPVYLPRLL